ncbi:MAG: DUF4136 domain-containing protein [Gammaproteobacteria bacterium]|jgi:hypothetical protein
MNKNLFFQANSMRVITTKSLFILFLSLMTGACQTVDESSQATNTKRLAMVSHFDSKYIISASKNTFAWKADSSFVLASEHIKPGEFKPLIENAITVALKNKGYKFSQDVDNSDLLVSYAAGLEEELSDKEITRRFGMIPGLQGNSANQDKYEKGTIIVDIFDKSTNRSVWRGVVQGFADLKMSRTERSKRLENIMWQLLAEFPAIL